MGFAMVVCWILPSLNFGVWDSWKQGFQSFLRMMSESDAGVVTALSRWKINCSLPMKSSNNLPMGVSMLVSGWGWGLWPMVILFNGWKMDQIYNEKKMVLPIRAQDDQTGYNDVSKCAII